MSHEESEKTKTKNQTKVSPANPSEKGQITEQTITEGRFKLRITAIKEWIIRFWYIILGIFIIVGAEVCVFYYFGVSNGTSSLSAEGTLSLALVAYMQLRNAQNKKQ